VTTQQMTEEMKESARREAALIRREAELEGDKLLESNRAEEAALRNEILMLKRQRRQVAEGLRATLDMYQRMIDQDLKDDPGAAANG
jgi:cell division initiation protein